MIEIRDLSKSFGARTVLSGVALRIRTGRVTAVVGPNGSGKSTLLKTVLGLVKLDHGTISFQGRRLNGDSQYREHIGYMPQIVRFPENLTGRELLRMLDDLRGPSGDRDSELLDVFDLERDLDKPFRTLSGGTRQKLNASLAFRFGADLMVLDEPTAGLDPVAARILKDKIRRDRDGGRTFVLASHIMSELEHLSDDIVFLLDGSVRYEGPVAELVAHTASRDLEEAVAFLMTGGRAP